MAARVVIVARTNFTEHIIRFLTGIDSEVFFKYAIPDWWTGGNLAVAIYFSASSASGNVKYGLSYRHNPGDDTKDWDGTFSSEQTVVVSNPTGGTRLQRGVITLTSLPSGRGTLHLKLRRMGTDASDTSAVSADSPQLGIEEP